MSPARRYPTIGDSPSRCVTKPNAQAAARLAVRVRRSADSTIVVLRPVYRGFSRSGAVGCVSSIASDFEVTLDVAVAPSAGEGSLVREDIVQFPVDDKSYGISRVILRVGFDVNCPFSRIECDDSHRNHIRPRVDDTRDVLAVPIHDNRYLIAVRWRGPPVAGPGTDQWMTFLRKGQC